MGTFQELDAETILKLLEGEKDVLKAEAEKEQVLLTNNACPICGFMTNEAVLNVSRPFSPGKALPNKVLRCLYCKTEYDPYSKAVLHSGLITASSD